MDEIESLVRFAILSHTRDTSEQEAKLIDETSSIIAAEIRAECPVRKAALEFVTDSYRPEPKHDAERFDKLCEALNYKPPKSWDEGQAITESEYNEEEY